MTKILITEFINQDSLNDLNNIFEIKFDEKLWEKNEAVSYTHLTLPTKA